MRMSFIQGPTYSQRSHEGCNCRTDPYSSWLVAVRVEFGDYCVDEISPVGGSVRREDSTRSQMLECGVRVAGCHFKIEQIDGRLPIALFKADLLMQLERPLQFGSSSSQIRRRKLGLLF